LWALGASLASFTFLAPASARADGYVLYNLTGDNGYNLIGINGSGDVAVESPFGCSSNDPNRCYEIFSDGLLVSKSDSLTGFTMENGAACGFSAGANQYAIGKSVCDAGNQVAGILNNGDPEIVELFSNGGSMSLFGSADVLWVNSSGDFAVVDGLNDEIEEVIPTPEPATLILLLTAAACVVMVVLSRGKSSERRR
jgi:hypothetical protein